ncbi:hypothetical protein J6590_035132 [Homalodisca vitripennis]|nr:hypothetical protein J6590_035132 [Homalodisca vitripennis]
MLGSMEEKIEALEENEQKHLTKIESLSVELTHSLSQLCKEKQFRKEMQKMFEEQDIKSQQTIESYYTKIKNLEKSLLTLQRNKSDDKNDQEPKIEHLHPNLHRSHPSTCTTILVTSVLDTHGVAKASVIKPPMNARSRTKDESIEEFYTTNIDYYISIMTNNQLPNADCIESNSFTLNSRPPISQQSPSESGQRSPPRAEDEQDKYFLDKTGLSNFKMKTALPYPN